MGIVERTWDEYWSAHPHRDWDDQSEIIYRIIRREYVLRRIKVLEVGSGTGRISAAVARDGNDVYLLDTSPEAFRIARRVFDARGLKAAFVRATAFKLPFQSGTFDLAWSAGLLEHFGPSQQREVVDEMIRTVRPGGRIIVIVPNRRAIVYDVARRISMGIGTWPYGPEEPLTANCLRSLGFRCISSGGRYYQLNFLSLIPGMRRFTPGIVRRVRSMLGDGYFDTTGSLGYLLTGAMTRYGR